MHYDISLTNNQGFATKLLAVILGTQLMNKTVFIQFSYSFKEYRNGNEFIKPIELLH